jgi:O-antigen/teichoic acid export membrane protein
MWRASGSIGLLGLLGVAYQRAGVLVLAVLVGPAATGLFAAASRIVEASKTGHLALFGALYPAMAEAHGSGPSDDSLGRPTWAWRLSLLGAVALAAVLLVAGPPLIALLYGPAFAPSAAGLALLALAIVPSTLAGYQSLELVAARRETSTVRALVASLVVLVVLLVALIPALGWTGAAWAILAAEMVQAVILLRVTGRLAAVHLRLPSRWPPPRSSRTAGGAR